MNDRLPSQPNLTPLKKNKGTTMKNLLLALLGFTLLADPLAATAQRQSGDFIYSERNGFPLHISEKPVWGIPSVAGLRSVTRVCPPEFRPLTSDF